MKIKTNQLTGAALDWAVAEAGGVPIYRRGVTMTRMDMDGQHYWQPSTDWAQGGPIIERERMTVEFFEDGNYPGGGAWLSTHIIRPYFNEEIGPTPLIAAMRCYVASKLGDEVEIPEELK